MMRIVLREIDFLLQFVIHSLLISPVEWSYWMQICASLNHRKKMKAEPNRLIPLKPIENLLTFFLLFTPCQLP